jgi:serine/threonine protein kinase
MTWLRFRIYFCFIEFFLCMFLKIGDLGLATTSMMTRVVPPSDTISPFTTFSAISTDVDATDATLSTENAMGRVGTAVYAPPEQLLDFTHTTAITEKVQATIAVTYLQTLHFGTRGVLMFRIFAPQSDIFVAGIIFFEMWHPFVTRQERGKLLADLRQRRRLPADFVDHHPNQSKLILMMTEPDPTIRPSAQQVLHSQLMPAKMEDDHLQVRCCGGFGCLLSLLISFFWCVRV